MTPRRRHPRGSHSSTECTCHLDLSIVCTHIVAGERPVLLMWRDREDSTLGLACGKADHPTTDDWAMAHPVHFMMNDPAMGIMRTLRDGEAVERRRIGAPWQRRPPAP